MARRYLGYARIHRYFVLQQLDKLQLLYNAPLQQE